MAFRIIDAKPINCGYFKAGTGGTTAEGLVVIDTGTSGTTRTVIKATAPVTAASLVGIARSTVDSGSYTWVDLVENHTIEATYTGSSKTTVADTDAGAVFDISSETVINLDDTTGGCFVAFGNSNYDNTAKTLKGKFTLASRLV